MAVRKPCRYFHSRERQAYRRERILCNNNNIVMYRSRREMTLYTKRGKSVEKGYKKTEIN
jgi:hypothetical protein